jgi:hypothetical protein
MGLFLTKKRIFTAENARMNTAIVTATLLCISVYVVAAEAALLRDTIVVAISGTPSPDKTGELFIPLRPGVQNGDQAVFVSDIRDNGFLQGSGIFKSGFGGLELLARSGDALPDANGVFHAINDPDIQVNNHGAIAWYNLIDSSLGGSIDNQALFYTDGSKSGISIVARTNHLDPTSTGKFTQLPNLISFNDAGQVSFKATLDFTSPGIFRVDGPTGDGVIIALAGGNLPGDTGTFSGFQAVQHSMNEAGQVAFHANVVFDKGGGSSVIYVGDGATTTEIVRKNEAAPSGNGELLLPASAYFPVNEAGQVAFVSTLTGTSGGSVDNEALFTGSSDSIVEIARKGDFAPAGNGRYLLFDRRIQFNNENQVAFRALLTGSADGAEEGIFIGTSDGVGPIARQHQEVPGGGRIAEFQREISLNNRGEVLFFAFIDLENGGSPLDTHGLFLHDGTGIRSIARVGDQLPGTGPITQIHVGDDLLSTGPESSPLSDHGTVTYRFTSGGDIGIALYLPPLFADGFEGGAD